MLSNTQVKRTEIGWAGHFILAERCLFRRNTLLEYEQIKIVVSSVGNLVDIQMLGIPSTIGSNRYYETMAFHVGPNCKYLDADVGKQIHFNSPGGISTPHQDIEANQMHEVVVAEISERMLAGDKFESD